MKLLLDIKDSKAPFVLELLKNLPFVRTTMITPYKAEILEGIKEAVGELKKIEKGKLKGIRAKDLINEL